jgi:hypothetical protein
MVGYSDARHRLKINNVVETNRMPDFLMGAVLRAQSNLQGQYEGSGENSVLQHGLRVA